MAAAEAADVTVEGVVQRVLFESAESGFAVLHLRTDDGRVTATGTLLGVQEGDRLRLNGTWRDHPKYGRQLEVASYVTVTPSTLDGIRRFLASGRLHGVGPVFAGRMVERFGLETLEVIEREPERLLEIRGIGPGLVRSIQESWSQHRGVQQVMVFLQSHGASPALAGRIHRRFGPASIAVVRENPYRLAEEVRGVGFLTADRVAAALGLPPDAPQRLQAGLLHTLERAAEDGHVFLPAAHLVEAAAALLGCEPAPLEPAIVELTLRGAVVAGPDDGDRPLYLPRLAAAEERVAARLRRLARQPLPPLERDVAAWLGRYEAAAGLQLAPEQRQAVTLALGAHGLVVVTGGPGTGKTTLLRCLVEVLRRHGRSVLLAAPTGRAAKRLEQACGQSASTIHRLLEFSPVTGEFQRGEDDQLEADLLIVDEVSMLDIELAASLLAAVPDGCRLVLVGDADQLPSVGPGAVLADLVAATTVATVRLHHVFRQAQRSLIVRNAHRINSGEMPRLAPEGRESDFFFITRDDPEAAAAAVVDLVTRRIPLRFALDPVEDVQVLTPMHRGELGVTALNQRLQAVLNPHPGPQLTIGARSFCAGDKVMQLRNNYDLDVFNGDLGRVLEVDTDGRTLVVEFDGRPVAMATEDLDDLTVAYACTIHKSQGSEYPAVVVVVHHQHHIMLQRNLLYTALTRGRRLVVLVGSRRALGRAVRTASASRRFSRLRARLEEGGGLASGPRRKPSPDTGAAPQP